MGTAFADFLRKDTFNDNGFYIRALGDQPSIMSAYAFMLGIYPDALNGIEVHADQLDGAIPVTSKDINSIRPDCGLQTPSSKKFEALDLWPGNKDHAFLSKALEQYPGLK